MRVSRWLIAIWFCFVIRAFFYCAALPIWEGYDEWSHFAVVQRMAFYGEPLVSRFSLVPRDVAASLDLAPVAWECRNFPLPALTYDAFWRLPPDERARREAGFRRHSRGVVRARTPPAISPATKDCRAPSPAGSRSPCSSPRGALLAAAAGAAAARCFGMAIHQPA